MASENREENQENKKRKYQRRDAAKPKIVLSNKMTSFVVLLCSFLLVLFIALLNITPHRYNIQVGSVAPETIEATKDIVDNYTTDLNKKAAREAVGIKYTQDNTASESYQQKADNFFNALISLKQKEYDLLKARAQQSGTAIGAITEVNLASALTDSDYNTLKTYTGIEMTKEEIKSTLSISDADLNKLKDYVKQQTSAAYTEGLKQEAIAQKTETILKDIKSNYLAMYNKLSNTLNIFFTGNLKPNIVEDTEATEKAQKAAEDAVSSVTYQKGQAIVRKGDIVTEAGYSVLNDLGLINTSTIDLSLYMGTILYIALIYLIFAYYVYNYEKKILEKKSSILLLGIIISVSIFITYVLGKIDPRLNIIYYGALLCSVVFGMRLGALVNLFLVLLVSMLINNDTGAQSVQEVYIAVSSLIGSFAGLLYIKRAERSNYIKSGLIAGFVSATAIAAILGITNNDMTTLLISSGYMIINSSLSAILLIGTLPIYETFFNVLTVSKLLELSDPKNPLLKRLAIEAPGTYHHSMLVANLAENAAEVIQANGLLARVGAYYHDIGKLRRPNFFAENQQGDNPHDGLEPRVSASIILSHPKDGLRFASQYKLPSEICDIIEQHHGTTMTAYFYDKELCAYSGDKDVVNKEDFTYPNTKPITKEAAIVMPADTVEAAIRAMPSKTEKELKDKINKLVDQKMKESQLDECFLSFRELSSIKDAFLASYNGASHQRIEYPEINWTEEE